MKIITKQSQLQVLLITTVLFVFVAPGWTFPAFTQDNSSQSAKRRNVEDTKVESSRPAGLIGIGCLNENLVKELGFLNRGAVILYTAPSSPARQAKLQAGDIVTKVNQTDIGDFDDVFTAMANVRAGDSVAVAFSRKGEGRSIVIVAVAKTGPRDEASDRQALEFFSGSQ